MTIIEALKASKKVKVGGAAHIGDYAIVKYGRDNYHTYKAGYLFRSDGYVAGGTLEYCLGRVFNLSQVSELQVIVDNN